MKNILVAIDFEETSNAVLERATELVSASAGKLWLIHVAAPDPDFVGQDAGPQSVRDPGAGWLPEEQRALQGTAAILRDRGLDTTALLVYGPTVATILKEARKLDADLIVMGSHGRGALLRTLLGSTCEGVLHRTEIPILIVPARACVGGERPPWER